jgi:hypothetical protein
MTTIKIIKIRIKGEDYLRADGENSFSGDVKDGIDPKCNKI